jgi:hypothetical protein
MATSKKTKPAKKAPARAKKPAVGKKKVVKRKASASRPRKRRAGIKSLRNYWAIGLVAGALIIAGALVLAQRDIDTPTPLESQVGLQVGQVVREVAQVPPPAPSLTSSPVVSPVSVAPPAVPVVEDKGPLREEFSSVSSKQLPDRIEFWSSFLTRPDSHERLSTIEGAPQISDSAPLLPNRYDCTTFVETVVALARSQASKDFFANLVAIRYHGGKNDYLHRNHFPEIDWIPNNEKAGILKDVTWDIAESSGCSKQAEKKVIDRAHWLAQQVKRGKVSRSIASVEDGAWSGSVEAVVPYIALADVARTESSIPDGAVLNIVRKSKQGTPVLITHQGFVIHKDGKAWLRHASVGGNIRTLMLSDYLRELSKKAEDKDWPVIGINLNRIL